ncbi:PREDICTED: calmodulin-binding transcription activator 4-like [Nicotiana attenuata]|uniref:Calmodulin-binding transcription activator 4 n=1 Tax=Nicotiana attenuata TaxID=49451 RepID=A0A314KLP5_NICAT|nr:PREDICTED: calmodulin-binding transcription activator 4-like [Nicotiana attenuata]OIT30112.1 calmodulin-binding transcription activator 4 [Nicotiana attenuata]
MAESGYDINDLVREAQIRWLKPAEVLFILRNHEHHQLSNEPAQKPPSGSLFLFNKRVLRFFRKDGHSWRKKKDGRTVGEAHERLKVGNAEALNCYYAHGEQNPNFQRRSYWMLDPVYEHIVLVHYRDITEGRQNPAFMSESSPISSTFSPSPSSYSTQQTGSTVIAGESYEQYQNQSSPGEICSDAVINNNRMSDITGRTNEVMSSPGLEMSHALRRLEEQLSLNDDSFKEIDPLYADAISDDSSLVEMQGNSNSLLLQHHSAESSESHHQHLTQDGHIWKDMLDHYGISTATESLNKSLPMLDENGMLQISSERGAIEAYQSDKWPNFSEKEAQKAPIPAFKRLENFKYHAYSPGVTAFGSNSDQCTTIFDQDQIGTSLEDEMSLTISQKQKFTIRDISPDWGYSSEATKVVIIGSFLCNPSECMWTCMFGDTEVPIQIIQEGVICCQAPPHLPGKVTLCVTSGNRESCSEVKEFEYRVKPDDCARNNRSDVEGAYKSTEELLVLVRFVQMLLLDLSVQKEDSSELSNDFLEKSKANEDSWSQVIESLLFGTSTSTITIDWLLQELLKDKFQQWLSYKLQRKDNQMGCSLSKKEQGIIHMVSGLGFEWALHPILNAGVSVNFRDINGWTALHWAARFGREKMVASLIAFGASAGAVTDPSSRDPVGKTAASIASSCGHKGLAGYLSEVALTSHLSSLTLVESELSKGTADVEAEKTISSISNTSATTNEDQRSLKDSLAAVRNAAQAAARIQSAFRAHSFRKRQQRESAVANTASGDEYGILSNDIHGLSAASKWAFRNTRDYNSAALAIQKKYRGWKGRKDFLAFRQKVVKIQAHVRGYQVRKQYKVCWAVGILEKVVLRWRRRGVGLRGFRPDAESIDESEDEDILKVFRKQKVDAALDEAVSRVLSMVESPGARQQYHRILEKYRQAKAELEGAESETASTAHGDMSNMENDDIYQFPSY